MPPSYIQVHAVVSAYGSGQTHTQTDTHTHRRAWPQYILRRLRLTQNVKINSNTSTFQIQNLTEINETCTVKLHYNRLGYNGYSFNTHFFLVLAESQLISMCENRGSQYILVVKFRTFKDPAVAFSRTNYRWKFTACTASQRYLISTCVIMVQF